MRERVWRVREYGAVCDRRTVHGQLLYSYSELKTELKSNCFSPAPVSPERSCRSFSYQPGRLSVSSTHDND